MVGFWFDLRRSFIGSYCVLYFLVVGIFNFGTGFEPSLFSSIAVSTTRFLLRRVSDND